MTHEGLSKIIQGSARRVLHGILPDARLPMKCVVLTQHKCNKSHNRMLVATVEACRRVGNTFIYLSVWCCTFNNDTSYGKVSPHFVKYKGGSQHSSCTYNKAYIRAEQLLKRLLKKTSAVKGKRMKHQLLSQHINGLPTDSQSMDNMFIQEKYASITCNFIFLYICLCVPDYKYNIQRVAAWPHLVSFLSIVVFKLDCNIFIRCFRAVKYNLNQLTTKSSVAR